MTDVSPMKLDGLRYDIFQQRYAMLGESQWEDLAKRVAKNISLAEINGAVPQWERAFYEAIVSGNFMPGGRILFGAGRRNFNMLNCFRLHPQDTVESIGKMIQDTYRISCSGGGIGFNFSDIRPKGDDIQNIRWSAPGAVSVMQMVNQIGRHVKSGKNRRTALIAILNVNHPDLFEFLHVKLDLEQLTNFNISVGITNEFLNAVRREKTWNFKFNGRIYYAYDIDRVNKHGTDCIRVFALNQEDAIGRAQNHYRVTQDDVFKNVKQIDIFAREIWNTLITNAWKSGDPGIYNLDLANSFTNVSYFEDLQSPNPCSIGTTLVAVADGRGNVPIQKLAEENKDVPVYCFNDNGKIVIRMMRHPRKTGINVPVFKVTIEGGHEITVTGNHKFALTDGSDKRVDEMSIGDSLSLASKYLAPIVQTNRSKNYIWWNNNLAGRGKTEHRLIYEFYNGVIPKNHIIHHIDYDTQNNHIDNLACMSKKDHDELHSKDMLGDNNPMRRAKHEWSPEKWQQYHDAMSEAVSGSNNGRYSGFSMEEIKVHAINLTNRLGRRFSRNEWQEHAVSYNLPKQFSDWRKQHFQNVTALAKWAALECGIDHIDLDPRLVKTYQTLTNEGYDCVIEDNKVYVLKECEDCDFDLKIWSQKREISICRPCAALRASNAALSDDAYQKRIRRLANRKANVRDEQARIYSKLRFKFGRDPLKKEWQTACKLEKISAEIGRKTSPFAMWETLKEAGAVFNHKVIAIKPAGMADVYNGTVDKYHNFFVGGWEENERWLYLKNQNCGEQPLPPYGNCCLGHVNLANMYNERKNDVDWKKLATTIRIAVRFLDDVLTNNHYPIDECRTVGETSRRIGLGVTGLHYLLLRLGHVYGHEKCLEFLDRLFATFRNEAYKASISLAQEKGTFPAFDVDKYSKEEFFKQLPPRIQSSIKKHGIRNAVMLTVAPCGTNSMLLGVSSGIEPIFAPIYIRHFREGNILREEYVADALFTEYFTQNKDMSHFRGAYDVSVEQHIAVQATIQKYIDSAISKTTNLPNDYPVENLADVILEYATYVKGFTIYRQGSKGDEPLEPIDISDKDKLTMAMSLAGVGTTTLESCRDGKCDL
jgi:ribonucleotide reductase alpha subunit